MLACTASCLISACSGALGSQDDRLVAEGSGGSGGSPAGAGAGDGDGDASGGGDGDASDPSAAPDVPAPGPRLVRLTHLQWVNTVGDLLLLDDVDAAASSLRDDPKQGGFLFDNDAAALVVDAALWSGYQQAAASLAERVAGDATRLEKLAPQAGSDTARRDALIDAVGMRAHRRPLEVSDRDAYRALFDLGPTMYDGMDDFAAGARLFIEALLQSPMFLYRAELSGGGDDAPVPLDGYEVASRLSFLFWNTMPDDALFAAAADGRLETRAGVGAEVERMVSDPRASDMVVSFHDQLLETDKLTGVMPSASVYGDRRDLGRDASEERRRFVSHVFESDGSFADLLTSRETFVNAELADIYGLSGSYDDAFTRVDLDEGERAGLFTQIGFLATHAASVDPDPIHRGKFLAERITCKQIAAPPVDVPPPPAVSDKTNRERIEEYTEAPGSECAACHATVINPFGFPFESFDAIGAHRLEDQGKPVDTRASPPLDGARTEVADGVALAQALAESEEAHRCYVKHWLEFAHGRHEHALDEGRIERLAERSRSEGLSLSAVLVELVLSDGFLTRAPREAP